MLYRGELATWQAKGHLVMRPLEGSCLLSRLLENPEIQTRAYVPRA